MVIADKKKIIKSLQKEGFDFSWCAGGFYTSIPAFSKKQLDRFSEYPSENFSIWRLYSDVLKRHNSLFGDGHIFIPKLSTYDQAWTVSHVESYHTNLASFLSMLKIALSISREEAVVMGKISDTLGKIS